MNNSIWPFDTGSDRLTTRVTTDKLTCFFICPSTPKEKFDSIYNFISGLCYELGKQFSVEFVCDRAIDIVSSGIIQPEIWGKIKTSDVIIADVTGQNGNVMLELGVASAWRKKENVIIIREENSNEPFLFDINPARHIVYKNNIIGGNDLAAKLWKVLFESLSPIPFEDIPQTNISLPFAHSFSDGDNDLLWSPSMTHRRIKDGYLEFGSLYVYKDSWLSLGDLRAKNISISAEMKFTLRRTPDRPNTSWIGIMLRGQSFWANSGHLIYLRDDGVVIRTVAKHELGEYDDVKVGQITNFNPNSNDFVKFNLLIDDDKLSIKVDSVNQDIKMADLPYVFNAGRVQIQTFGARVGIKNIKISSL